MSEVKWIKITTDIFDDEKIILIESLPDAYAIITVWFKLLCLAGKQNNSGVFIMSNRIPYTEKMLATIFRMKESTVTMALRTFEEFGMIEVVDGVITIPNWGKHQSLEQLEERRRYQREYQREYRKKQKELTAPKEEESKCLHKHLHKHNVNTLDIDKEIDIDKNNISISEEPKKVRHKYGQYQNVLLDDEQMEKLKSEFSDWEIRIERLSEYMASTGKSYKNHLATIRSWARKEPPKNPQSFRGQQKDFNSDEIFEKPKVLPNKEEIEAFKKQIEIDYPDLESWRYEKMVESFTRGEWE